MSRDRVDFHQANILADQVVSEIIEFDDAAHRLFQYWETQITRDQAVHKLQRCVDAMTERPRDPRWR